MNVPFPMGTTTVTWTALDAMGNSALCVQTVTVSDQTPPLLSCGSGIVATASASLCSATLSIAAPLSIDACGSSTVSGVRSDGFVLGLPYPVGTTMLVWTATDVSGNTSSCSQTVTVSDTQAPVLVGVPANTTLSCPVSSAPLVTATDNCTGSPSVTMTELSGSGNCTSGYVLTRTWTATDGSGNTTTQTQTITVVGSAPALSISGAVVTNAGLGQSNGSVNISVLGGSCGGLYTYIWSNGATTQDISGVPGGVWYSVTVTCGSESVVGWYWVKNGTGRTKTDTSELGVVAEFSIAPNPFSDFTVISLQVSEAQMVQLLVFDLNGKQVASLFEGKLWPDQIEQRTFEAGNLPQGVYICQLRTQNGEVLQEQIIKVR